jgi:hypothetical protein
VRVGGCLTSRSSPGGGCGVKLASRGIDRGPARHRGSFCFYPAFYSSCDCKSRCHQSWTLVPAPIQVFTVVALLRFALFLQTLPLLTRAIPSMSEALWASNSSLLIILLILWPGRRYLESDITAESDKGPIMVVGIDIGAMVTARRRSYSTSYAVRYLRNKHNIDVGASYTFKATIPL